MEVSVPLSAALSLAISDGDAPGSFPSGRLRRGLVLAREGRDLAAEGVGFGVPVVKQGARTVFPGEVRLEQPIAAEGGTAVVATFGLNLVERLRSSSGGPTAPWFYAARDGLAALHRRLPPLRGWLTTASNNVRRRLGWATIFEEIPTCAVVAVAFDVRAAEGRVRVTVEPLRPLAPGISELVVMNELGALEFDRYADSDGTRLRGAAIGTWSEVAAATATFSGGGATFSVARVPGARLYRGRELVDGRLAWAGFGYSLKPAQAPFSYDVTIGEEQ